MQIAFWSEWDPTTANDGQDAVIRYISIKCRLIWQPNFRLIPAGNKIVTHRDYA
jgi:hypothetical protein